MKKCADMYGFSVLLSLLFLLAGCGGDPDFGPVGDLPAQPISLLDAPLERDTVPLVRIGDDDTHPLHLVRGATILDGDVVVIGTEGAQTLRYFDASGQLLMEVGGSGEGPGEFRRLRGVFSRADGGVLAWDLALLRLTTLDQQGEVEATLGLSTHGLNRHLPQLNHLHPLGDEYLSAITLPLGRLAYQRSPGLSRDEHQAAIFDHEGELIRVIEGIPGAEMIRAETTLSAPFSYSIYSAGTPEGFHVGNGRGPELITYGMEDSLDSRWMLPIERELVTPEKWERVLDDFLPRFASDTRGEIRRTLEEGMVVDSFSAYTGLEGTRAGGLWVELYALPDEDRPWLVVDLEERTARPITLPDGAQVLDATPDRVLLLERDSSDREIVSLYRIRG